MVNKLIDPGHLPFHQTLVVDLLYHPIRARSAVKEPTRFTPHYSLCRQCPPPPLFEREKHTVLQIPGE